MIITAIEAKKIANKFNAINRARAREFAQNELEAYLAPRIEKAAKEGAYRISYFWKRAVFQEMQIMPIDFEDALIELVKNLGYSIEAEELKQMGIIQEVRVVISWGKTDE